jgi:hypothetical protein
VIEGIALRVDPRYAIVKECFPYISRRLLLDDNPRMQVCMLFLEYFSGATVVTFMSLRQGDNGPMLFLFSGRVCECVLKQDWILLFVVFFATYGMVVAGKAIECSEDERRMSWSHRWLFEMSCMGASHTSTLLGCRRWLAVSPILLWMG